MGRSSFSFANAESRKSPTAHLGQRPSTCQDRHTTNQRKLAAFARREGEENDIGKRDAHTDDRLAKPVGCVLVEQGGVKESLPVLVPEEFKEISINIGDRFTFKVEVAEKQILIVRDLVRS